jgi:uncharacterized OB-fold protein
MALTIQRDGRYDFIGERWCPQCKRRTEVFWREETQDEVCGGCHALLTPRSGHLTRAEKYALAAVRDTYVAVHGVNLVARRNLGP